MSVRKLIKTVAVTLAAVMVFMMSSGFKSEVRADGNPDSVRQFVERLYRETLGREADEDGAADWTNRLLSGGSTGADVAFGFIFSDECRALTVENSDYVQVLYRAMLGREADEAGLNSWVSFLNAGHPRSNVFAGFVNSPEFTGLCAEYGIVRGNRRYVNPDLPMIALTFDDGPSGRTSELIDCLQSRGAAATFFVVGMNAERYTDTLARMRRAGCEIGNHTYDHTYLTRLSVTDIQGELGTVNDIVRAATGTGTTVLRPPGGYHNETVDAVAGMPLIMWSIDTRDWQTRSTQATIDHVLGNVHDGDIILMHDIYSTTIDAALYLIPELQRRGYQLVTVSELAEYRGGAQDGVAYYRFRP